MSETQEFLDWKAGFSWQDDGLHAFLSIKKIRQISAIMATKNEGWEDELEAILTG